MCNIWSRSWEINWNLSSGERQPGRENWLHKAWSYEWVWLLRGTERGVQLIRGGERWKEKAATVDLGLYWLGSAGGVGTSKKGKTEPLLRGREKTCKIHKSPARALGCYFLQQWLKKILKMENRESHFSVTELLTFPRHHLTGGVWQRGGLPTRSSPIALCTHTPLFLTAWWFGRKHFPSPSQWLFGRDIKNKCQCYFSQKCRELADFDKQSCHSWYQVYCG